MAKRDRKGDKRVETSVGGFAVAGSLAGIPFGIPLLGIVLGALVGATWAVMRSPDEPGPES